MVKHFFFVSSLDYKFGWGTLSINYLKELNSKNVIVFCNKKNNKLKFSQIEILHKPLDYLRNPFLVFVDYLKIISVLNKYKYENNYSHFPVEPYCLLLPFLNNYFKLNTYYAIGTYSLELNCNKKTKILFHLAKKKFNNVIFFSSFTKSIIEKEIKFNHFTNKKIINPIIYLKDKKIKVFKKFKHKTILCVGALKPRKGYDLLIKLLMQLNKNYNQKFKLILVGQSDNKLYKKQLISLIKKNNLNNDVKFEDNVSESKLSEFYKRSHIFVMLSKKFGNHFEGFGIVYLEALFYGLPIIVSRESGARDLLKISDKIKVFNPTEFKKIASCIFNLFKNHRKINPLTYRNILAKHIIINKLKLKNFYDKLN